MTLTHLIERCGSGRGPDRELDGDIAAMFNPDRFKPEYIRGQAKSYTTSLDAVLSLIKQKLPGWKWTAGFDGHEHYATLQRWSGAPLIDAFASSPARALLASTLRALSALEDSKAGLADATQQETTHDG